MLSRVLAGLQGVRLSSLGPCSVARSTCGMAFQTREPVLTASRGGEVTLDCRGFGFVFLKTVIKKKKIGLEQMFETNHFLIWLEIRLFSGLPSTQRSACDTAVWLPAPTNKRGLGKQLLTAGGTCASKAGFVLFIHKDLVFVLT